MSGWQVEAMAHTMTEQYRGELIDYLRDHAERVQREDGQTVNIGLEMFKSADWAGVVRGFLDEVWERHHAPVG